MELEFNRIRNKKVNATYGFFHYDYIQNLQKKRERDSLIFRKMNLKTVNLQFSKLNQI